MPISGDRITQMKRGASILAAGAVAWAATEMLPVSPVPTANASTGEKSAGFKASSSSFGIISDRVLNVSSKVLECITELGIKFHAPESDPTKNVSGAELTVYNSSTPDHKVRLKADIGYKFNKDGYADSKPNGYNPETLERFALLTGEKIHTCGNGCPHTEISAYESEDGKQVGPVATAKVDCPSNTVCKVNQYWSVGFRFPTTPTPELTQTPTMTSTPEATATATPGSGFVQRPR